MWGDTGRYPLVVELIAPALGNIEKLEKLDSDNSDTLVRPAHVEQRNLNLLLKTSGNQNWSLTNNKKHSRNPITHQGFDQVLEVFHPTLEHRVRREPLLTGDTRREPASVGYSPTNVTSLLQPLCPDFRSKP